MIESFIVSEEMHGVRLDKVLALRYPQYSRSYLTLKIKEQQVKLDRKKAEPSTHVVRGDQIHLVLDQRPVDNLLQGYEGAGLFEKFIQAKHPVALVSIDRPQRALRIFLHLQIFTKAMIF